MIKSLYCSSKQLHSRCIILNAVVNATNPTKLLNPASTEVTRMVRIRSEVMRGAAGSDVRVREDGEVFDWGRWLAAVASAGKNQKRRETCDLGIPIAFVRKRRRMSHKEVWKPEPTHTVPFCPKRSVSSLCDFSFHPLAHQRGSCESLLPVQDPTWE